MAKRAEIKRNQFYLDRKKQQLELSALQEQQLQQIQELEVLEQHEWGKPLTNVLNKYISSNVSVTVDPHNPGIVLGDAHSNRVAD